MRRRDTASKFLVDTNVYKARVKKGWTDTTELLLTLLAEERYRLFGNDVLLAEYRRYAELLDALEFFEFLRRRIEVVNPTREEVLRVLPYFPSTQVADAVHAATYLKTGAIMITNDRHFQRVADEGLIEVWSISEAIKLLLRR